MSVANAQIAAGDRTGALRSLTAFAPSATADGWKPVYSPGILLSLPLASSWVSSLVNCGDLPAALEVAKSVRAPGARAFALVGVANALTAAKDLANARRALTAALEAARLQSSAKTDLQRSPGETEMWGSCRIAMISSAMRRAGDPKADHVAADAMSLLLRIQDETARWIALARLGNVWWLAGDPADARRAFDAAHGEAAKIADPGRRYTADCPRR
jgi:hypothetical protein